MSIKAMTWAWQMPVKGNQKLILLALADHADDQGKCWPGIEGLAEKCGLSRSSVVEHIQELAELHLITKQKMHDENGYRRPSLYVLNLIQSPDIQSRDSLSRNIQRRKNLSRDLPIQSPDYRESKVQNLDGNIINRHKATVNETSHIGQAGQKDPLDPCVSDPKLTLFDEFWKSYPRKIKKKNALSAFKRLTLTNIKKIPDALEAQTKERELKLRFMGFKESWPHPTSWLNQERWNDEVHLDEEYWQAQSKKPASVNPALAAYAPNAYQELHEEMEKLNAKR